MAKVQIRELRDWMLTGRLPDCFNPRHDLRTSASQAAAAQLDLRLAAYEMLQEHQRVRPGTSVLVSAEWPAASVLDMADLVRTHVSIIGPATALREAAAAASVSEQVEFLDAHAAVRRHWDIVLTTSPTARTSHGAAMQNVWCSPISAAGQADHAGNRNPRRLAWRGADDR